MRRIKFNNKFFGMAAIAMTGLGLVSCSNELNEGSFGSGNVSSGVDGISLVKSPEVVAWSGNQTLGNSVSTRGVATRAVELDWLNYQKCVDYDNRNWSDWDKENVMYYHFKDNAPSTTDRGESVSQKEYDYVMEYLRQHPNEGSMECDLSTYFIQDVGTSGDQYELQFLQDDGTVHHTQTVTGGNQMDYLVIGSAHMADYNATSGPRALVVYNPVKPEISYHDSYNNLTWDNKYRFYYIPNEDGDGYSLYLCFDYATRKYDNGLADFPGDGIYNDWVIKLIPADGSEIVPPADSTPDDEVVTPPTTEPEDPDNGDNSDNDNNGDDTSDNGQTPSSPLYHNDEVEVNYAILDTHDNLQVADLVTKLSIHVRKATDVDIKIPIPHHYLVESDDLYIFKEHFVDGDGNGSYGGTTLPENPLENENTFISYNVNGNIVTLYVEFEKGDLSLGSDFEYGYIHVYTTGINQDVIDACWNYNKDGINFEIYNYFQTAKVLWNEDGHSYAEKIEDVNRAELLEAMNKSVISFTDAPSYYINAFGYAYENGVATGEKHDSHATVTPAYDQGFEFSHTGTHLNSTPYNDIWVNENVESADLLHRH